MLSRLKKARIDLATMHRLLPEAERIAQEQGDEYPSAEHLVAAALSLDDGIAAATLAAHGVDREGWLEAVRQQHHDALGSIGLHIGAAIPDQPLPAPESATGPLRSQRSFQDAFQRAVSLAKQERTPLTSAHVLLAAIQADHGTVARTLARLGLDPTALAAELRTHL